MILLSKDIDFLFDPKMISKLEIVSAVESFIRTSSMILDEEVCFESVKVPYTA